MVIRRIFVFMEKIKLTENEAISRFRKILLRSDKKTFDKYNGILYFISQLESDNKNAFDILQREFQKQ